MGYEAARRHQVDVNHLKAQITLVALAQRIGCGPPSSRQGQLPYAAAEVIGRKLPRDWAEVKGESTLLGGADTQMLHDTCVNKSITPLPYVCHIREKRMY